MSDWEDEPVGKAPSRNGGGGDGDGWGDSSSKPKEASGWSDNETETNKGGGGGGYRGGGRRDGEGGGGYRGGRRDGEGGGGYRGGRRDGEEGGGRRDGEGGGGYRGRRDRDDNGEEELVKLPSSYDKETVSRFIEQLDVEAFSTLAKVRQLRDYLMKAFKELVSVEWEEWTCLEREQRKQKALKLREAALMSDRIISDINRLLEGNNDVMEQREHEQQNMFQQLQELSINWRLNNADNGPSERSYVVPTSRRVPRNLRVQNQSVFTERILELYAQARELPEEAEEIDIEQELNITSAVMAPPTVGQRFPRWLSENYVRLHEMRTLKVATPNQLRQEMAWPRKPMNVWLSHRHPQRQFLAIKEQEQAAYAHTSSAMQGSSVSNVPRLQGSLQDTPDGNLFFNRVQGESTRNEDASGGIDLMVNTTQTSSDGLHLIMNEPLPTNLNDIDETPPTLPPAIPGEFSLPSGMDNSLNLLTLSGDSGGESNLVSTVRLRGARIISSSTPLGNYRPQLPAIDEEQQQNRLTFVERMRENEPSPPSNDVAPPPPTVVEELSMLVTPPPSPRNWTSIFRTRDELVNYEGMTGTQSRSKRPRRARRPTVRRPAPTPPLTPERVLAEQPRSNHEIATTFVANLLQTAVEQANVPQPVELPNVVEAQQEISNLVENQLEMAQIPMDIEQELVAPPAPVAGDQQIMNISHEQVVPAPVLDLIEPLPLQFPAAESSLMNTLPDQPIVTSMQIIYAPSSHLLLNEASAPQSLVNNTTTSTRLMIESPNISLTRPTAAKVQPQQRPSLQDRLYRESLDDLGFLVQHTDALRLMVDHQKQLSDQQNNQQQDHRQQNLPYETDTSEGVEDFALPLPPQQYRSLPATYTYDSQSILDASPAKIKVVHGLFGALIMLPKVDMHNAGFISNRMEAAIAYRMLMDLKAANIVDLSNDSRYCWLR